MQESLDSDIIIRLLLYPLILIIIIFAAFGIFYMTLKETDWNSINKENSLYSHLLYIYKDLLLLFTIFPIILFKSSLYILFAFLLILLVRPLLESRWMNIRDLRLSAILFVSLLFIICVILFIKFKSIYNLTILGSLLSLLIIYQIALEMTFYLTKNLCNKCIEESVEDRYKSSRKGFFYLSIAIAIVVYLELGIYSAFSYALGGINWQILQENMTFILFASLNIILLIDIFKKYF